MLKRVNVGRVNASYKIRIFEVVRETVGFGELNSIVFAELRQWMIAEASKEADDFRDGNWIESMNSKFSLASLYKSQGRYDEAEPLYVECLQKMKVVLGENHPNTMTFINDLALLYYSQGRYDEAEPLYVECLQKKKVVLGENHPSTLTSINNLAALYKIQGRYDEAEHLRTKIQG
jgi:tetratricopeptide (TPR) repeat protein